MKHKVKVVMLPTEDKFSHLALIFKKRAYSVRGFTSLDEFAVNLNQHAYVTVSQDVEPIKKGDWITDRFEVIKASSKIVNAQGLVNRRDWRKIIATDDPKLNEIIKNHNDFDTVVEFTQLPQSFLKEYVANPNGGYEVEYETVTHNKGLGSWVPTFTTNKIKLNQNNTVNITSIEEKMYSRDEVVIILHNCCKSINEARLSDGYMSSTDWIKKNL
jgi:hypothetical protein